MAREILRIPYIKETEKLVFEQYPKIWEGLVTGKVFGSSWLRGLVFNYPNTLLFSIQPLYHDAVDKQKGGKKFRKDFEIEPSLSDYIGEISYLLPRLADKETIAEIFERIKQGQRVEIHFGERFDQELERKKILKRPTSRGRRYFEEVDENGILHIYFEIRRQTLNDEKNPPTDFLELMSFLGFYEMTRFLVSLSIRNPKALPKVGKARKKLLEIVNKFLPEGQTWTFKDLKNWANSSGGIYLSNASHSYVVPLSSLTEKKEKHELALYDAVMNIGLKMEEKSLVPPEAIVLGNEFTFPLILAIPLLTEEDLAYLANSQETNKEGKPLDLLPESIKKEKLDKLTQNTLTRFMYLQFLSRYNGKDPRLKEIRQRIFTRLEEMGVITRIFEATETSLGDSVDYYDFSKLDKAYFHQLENAYVVEELKIILIELARQKKHILNFSYPLGDNTYGLIEAISNLIPSVNNIVFFGKVGATLQWDGENHLGARVGRVVSPEYVSSINDFNPQEFINRLKEYNIPLPVIVNADEIELIFQSEGVLLQTLRDIKKAQEAIIQREDIPYNEKIKLLIDMESYYLFLICKKVKITPSVVYYTSDNTKIPPLPGTVKESIITSLGPRGSFAVMVAGLGALKSLIN
jgi:hypothetical protein